MYFENLFSVSLFHCIYLYIYQYSWPINNWGFRSTDCMVENPRVTLQLAPIFTVLHPCLNQLWSAIAFVVDVVQSLSCVRFFLTPHSAALQASLFLTISQSLPKFMSIESMMPSSVTLFSFCFNLSQHQGLFQWVVCHAFLQGIIPIQGSTYIFHISCIGRPVLYH